MDYTYPLPQKYLHARYDHLFLALTQGQSVTLVGLPQSARSGYLKFILEFDQTFLSQFIDPNIHHFIVIEGQSLAGDQLIHIIASKLLTFNCLPQKSIDLLESRLKIHDPHLTLTALKTVLTNIYPAHCFTIILYEAEKLLDHNPQAINFLTQIWNTNRNQPHSQITLCFIGSPLLLEKKQQLDWTPLRPAFEETTLFFPLFNSEEMDYLYHRLQYLTDQKITLPIHRLAQKLSGGHTVLYRLLTQLALPELHHLEATHSHPAIDSLLTTIWESFPHAIRQNWSPQFLSNHPLTSHININIPLLPLAIHLAEPVGPNLTVPQLTSQQKIILDFFISRTRQIITRDELAQVMWGKLWHDKYSDWAIDRSISKLRRKLAGSTYTLLTLRNRGYQLTSN